MLKKVVVPAAGLGTRLLPATKEQPKEMFPVFSQGVNGNCYMKPFLQIVFEQLYYVGFRDFCFIVGRGKRSIEDHFTLDSGLAQDLVRRNKPDLVEELGRFYKKVENSKITFINQLEPRGFGHAILQAKGFVGKETFLVHAGDDLIYSRSNRHLKILAESFENQRADAMFYVERVRDPRQYGVVTAEKVKSNLYRVTRIDEKPMRPLSNLAVIAIYVFSSSIFHTLEGTIPDINGEIQLTDAIQKLIDNKCAVYALQLGRNKTRVGTGDPDSYWSLLESTRRWAKRGFFSI